MARESTITILNSTTSSATPGGDSITLAAGELAINRADNKLFYRNAAGNGDTTAYLPTQALGTSSSVEFGALDIDNFSLNSTTLALSSGDLTIDAEAGDIILDAHGADVYMRNGTNASNYNRLIFGLSLSESTITSQGAMKLVSGTSADLTLDSDGDIILDCNGTDIFLKDNGTAFGQFTNNSGNLIIESIFK